MTTLLDLVCQFLSKSMRRVYTLQHWTLSVSSYPNLCAECIHSNTGPCLSVPIQIYAQSVYTPTLDLVCQFLSKSMRRVYTLQHWTLSVSSYPNLCAECIHSNTGPCLSVPIQIYAQSVYTPTLDLVCQFLSKSMRRVYTLQHWTLSVSSYPNLCAECIHSNTGPCLSVPIQIYAQSVYTPTKHAHLN
ncbi:hypothetical protein DPMN_123035 [Dreissena polymorpha]|uniref:Uncharacterized protein n=1 Tax=Dreissena polymorpha TaxID=45954 RepID=A0A9D4JUZ9_DREPO|nr:hypothetical protein DPMN_123035 [Dreissena polymorpha]